MYLPISLPFITSCISDIPSRITFFVSEFHLLEFQFRWKPAGNNTLTFIFPVKVLTDIFFLITLEINDIAFFLSLLLMISQLQGTCGSLKVTVYFWGLVLKTFYGFWVLIVCYDAFKCVFSNNCLLGFIGLLEFVVYYLSLDPWNCHPLSFQTMNLLYFCFPLLVVLQLNIW